MVEDFFLVSFKFLTVSLFLRSFSFFNSFFFFLIFFVNSRRFLFLIFIIALIFAAFTRFLRNSSRNSSRFFLRCFAFSSNVSIGFFLPGSTLFPFSRSLFILSACVCVLLSPRLDLLALVGGLYFIPPLPYTVPFRTSGSGVTAGFILFLLDELPSPQDLSNQYLLKPPISPVLLLQ